MNTIGPKVYLTPGSISVAVDRLLTQKEQAGSYSRSGGFVKELIRDILFDFENGTACATIPPARSASLTSSNVWDSANSPTNT